VRALLSVHDKTGLVDLAAGLEALGWELVSSGGTAAALRQAGVHVTEVADVTGAPEMLDGRVKTLHPAIHGGILADRSKASHRDDLQRRGIAPIDLVVCNLYPFRSDPSVELIDVGGPTMVRAAAKNHDSVGVVVDPASYGDLLEELKAGGLSAATRLRLARAAFAHTAAYDAAIVEWLDGRIAEEAGAAGEEAGAAGEEAGALDAVLPPTLHLSLERAQDLRYGENPHQRGARYRTVGRRSWWDDVVQHGGMALSYLNLYDADAAWSIVHDLGDGPAAVVVKHANPCGVGVADDLATAYRLAYECDEKSAFGGIVAVNRPIDEATVALMAEAAQADVVIAPGYAPGVVERLAAKRKNTRVLEAAPPEAPARHLRQIGGGFLVQEPHRFVSGRADWRVVTTAEPDEGQWGDIELAWRVCGHVKSNAIVFVKGGAAWGIGAGQQNRVDSTALAAQKAAGRAAGGVAASDAFFPFPDGVEAAAEAGIAVVVQPGGAMRDDAVIARADELGLAMVLTGERHFLH
jgi:phosphoribosylaminoimidazolecarboxamide formyltransferase/IMP cyclohydrolase